MKKLFTIMFLFFFAGITSATISWMGNKSVTPSNPSADQTITFYVEMWDNYFGCHAEVVIDLYSDGSWNSYTDMPYKGPNGNNSTWETSFQLPQGTHKYYFHGWDDWGANVYDNNNGSNYTIVVNEAVPVQLASFTASVRGKDVKLNWQTATEVNNYGFEIERVLSSNSSIQGWTKIGFVNGHGNSNALKSYSFTDKDVLNGSYSYRLKQIDADGNFEYSPTVEVTVNNLPSQFELSQNYPNPFNPSTVIKYSLPSKEFVQLRVFNLLGNEIATLVNEVQEASNYTIEFNAAKINITTSGIYFYRLEAGTNVVSRKMTLVK